MSRLKNMPRGGWIVVGIVIAVIAVPTAAVAATATLVKIKGTSGTKADVSPANQLLTTEADPSSLVNVGRSQAFARTAQPEPASTRSQPVVRS
jgi:hypothetical protein